MLPLLVFKYHRNDNYVPIYGLEALDKQVKIFIDQGKGLREMKVLPQKKHSL